MSRKARTRAAVAALLTLVAGGILAFGQFSGTFAIFSAETDNAGTVSKGSWIPKPSGLTSSLDASTYSQEHLAWTSGNSTVMPSGANPVTGQSLYYADGGVATAGSATCGAYSSFKTETAAATADDVTGTNLTDWWCFEIFSTSTAATTSGTWTSDPVTFTAQRLFVASSVAENDHTSPTSVGTAKTNDQLVIAFNQNWAGGASVNVRFCSGTSATAKVLVSTATMNNCNATPNIGTITGQSVGTSMTCNGSGASGGGTTTLTITLACGPSTSAIGATTATFTPASALTSSGAQHVCTSTSAPDCRVTTTTRF